MNSVLRQLDRLVDILRAECQGCAIDREEALRLAQDLAASCPSLRSTFDSIRRRLAPQAAV